MNAGYLTVAVVALLLASPAVLAGGTMGSPAERPPMLTIDHLGKYGGAVVYIDWDGKLWRESNSEEGLQRLTVVTTAGTFRHQDDSGLLP